MADIIKAAAKPVSCLNLSSEWCGAIIEPFNCKCDWHPYDATMVLHIQHCICGYRHSKTKPAVCCMSGRSSTAPAMAAKCRIGSVTDIQCLAATVVYQWSGLGAHLLAELRNNSCVSAGKCAHAGRIETPGLYSISVAPRTDSPVPTSAFAGNVLRLSIIAKLARRFVVGVRTRPMCRDAPEALDASAVGTQHAQAGLHHCNLAHLVAISRSTSMRTCIHA